MKKIILGIAAFLLVFGLGVLMGKKLNSKQQVTQEVDKTKETLQSQLPQLPEGMEIKSANGIVQKISGNVIILKTSFIDPLANRSTDTLTVKIDANTKFYQLVQRDLAQFQKEMEEFNKKMQEQSANPGDQPLTPPMPQDKKEITLADIKEGQQISISSEENIYNKTEFVAKEVSVQFVPNVEVGGDLPTPSTVAGQPAVAAPNVSAPQAGTAPTAPITAPAPGLSTAPKL